RARGEQLAELHERRPELVEHQPQPSPPVRGRRAVSVLVGTDEIGEAIAAEEVAEPVTCRHLCDLGEAAQGPRRPLLGRRHGRVCRPGVCSTYELRSSSLSRCSSCAPRSERSSTESFEAVPSSVAALAARLPPLSPSRTASRRQLSRMSASTERT